MNGTLEGLIEQHRTATASRKLLAEDSPARPIRLPLGAIREIPEVFQPREGISEQHVNDLAKVLNNTGDLDPILVMVVGADYVLIDGHHRLEAYKSTKGARHDIPARYFEGDPLAALVEVGSENGKVRLNLSPRERQDFAWRLVLTGLMTRPQIEAAAGISRAQVTLMRKARATLGEDAGNHRSWFKARSAASGEEQQQFSEDDIRMWKEQKADRYANELARRFGTGLANDTEVAAMALATHFGRKLEDLVRDLGSHLPDGFEMDTPGGLF